MKSRDIMVLLMPNDLGITAIRFIGESPSPDDPILRVLDSANRDGVRRALLKAERPDAA